MTATISSLTHISQLNITTEELVHYKVVKGTCLIRVSKIKLRLKSQEIKQPSSLCCSGACVPETWVIHNHFLLVSQSSNNGPSLSCLVSEISELCPIHTADADVTQLSHDDCRRKFGCRDPVYNSVAIHTADIDETQLSS